MPDNTLRIAKNNYRHIFLAENRGYWISCPFEYDKEKDLVLSFDFGLVNAIKQQGGEAQYLDHIVDSKIMENYNHKTYEFFAQWHLDAEKQDIFNYKGIDIGSAFRIEIWNDLTFYMRLFINISELFKNIKYEVVYAGIKTGFVMDIIKFLNIKTQDWKKNENIKTPNYYLPIFEWMNNALHALTFRDKIRIFALKILGIFFYPIKNFDAKIKKKKYIYIEWYHPTDRIISELRQRNDVVMVRSDFNGIRDIINGLHLPIFTSAAASHKNQAKQMLENFKTKRHAALTADGADISDELYHLIINRISPLLAKYLAMVDAIMKFFKTRPLDLMITISSVGIINRLMINYCEKNNIAVYMIINGWLGNYFLDEAKNGTWINAYGESIKNNYFKNMDNIVCLGDPRMDIYVTRNSKKPSSAQKKTIGIGSSAFTNVDLNCYLAIEFEFLNDVLKTFKELKTKGREADLFIKLRGNSHIESYRNFIAEYYPDIAVNILDTTSMMQAYEKSDLYISIYSQSLIEASALGIPILYYKNDTQYFQPPFDGHCELVTATTQKDLTAKIEAFFNGDKMYDAFKEKKVMEKYIGPLDGHNLERNMNFIASLCRN